jgi:N utilization substance protein B
MPKTDGNAGSYEYRRRARRRVLQALYQWQMTGDSAAKIISQFLDEQSWERVDREYFELLLNQSINETTAITTGLQPFLDRPLEQVDCLERSILQLAAAELRYHPDLPFRVVLDEAIDLAKRFGAEQSHSYVNAVLDKAAREWRASEIPVKSAAAGDD